jgi:hypothetical protein
MKRLARIALLTLFVTPFSEALGIPAFARKYRVSCSLCHSPAPRLNAIGERFAENGFQFAVGEKARDTLSTGDPLLYLQSAVPLAVRFDAYATALSSRRTDEATVDLQAPWVMKLLTGGQISDRISYYAYFLLGERGEVAGLEDAYVQFTDIASSGVSLIVGQFQLSDPLFKRELRLSYEDYQAYRVRVGANRGDLTYDRGLMALWSPRSGTDVTLQLVTGQGLGHATEMRQYDRDPYLNPAFRISQDAGRARLGVYAYYGRERADGNRNEFWIFGPDATLSLGRLELNAQWLRRSDDNPMLEPVFVAPATVQSSEVDAGFLEAIYEPGGPGGRLFVTGLLNWVEADRPIFTLRAGELPDQPLLHRYRTTSAGVHWLLRRNIRLLGELGWDLDRERARLTTGVVTAF